MNFFTLCMLLTAVVMPAALATNSSSSSQGIQAASATELSEETHGRASVAGLRPSRCTAESCGGSRNTALFRKVSRLREETDGLFLSSCDIKKLDWCHSHRGSCPGGRFPVGRLSALNCGSGSGASPSSASGSRASPSSASGSRASPSSASGSGASPSSASGASADAPSSSSSSSSSSRSGQEGDGDRCCQTKTAVVRMEGSMQDSRNQLCHVVSLNDTFYQFAHTGSCYSGSAGSCDGQCFQEKKYVTLLCLEPTPGRPGHAKLAFRLFPVNGYCSCRYFTSE